MPKTLLLADDSVTIQKVVGISFANEDIELLTVDNGDDAIARAREVRPDLILADAVMPGKNGYEVCEAIKQDPKLRHIPVLLLTGTFESFDAEQAQAVGIDGQITKPFEAQALVEQVKTLLQRAEAAAPPQPGPPTAAAAPPTQSAAAAPPSAPTATLPGDSGSVQAYDFFDDDLSELSTGTPAGSSAAPAAADRTMMILPDGPGASASTEAILGDSDYDIFEGAEQPDEAPLGQEDLASLDFVSGDPVAVTAEPLAPSPGDPAATSLIDNAFEFGVEDTPPPVEVPDAVVSELTAGDLGQQTIVDPRGASGYDVSVSDLGDPLAAPGAREDLRAAVTKPGPSAPPQPAHPAAAERPAAAPGHAAPGSRPEPSPAMRQRIHDTLEKVAWEAFSDLSETVVRQALERVERIAWEVIPQMAEELIREEIRHLKGEPEKS